MTRAGTAEAWPSALRAPRSRQRADQQQQAEQAGEHRQHADAAHHAGVAHLQADPVVAADRCRSSASRRCAAAFTPDASARRRASPPVAAASGASTSVVDVTSANSRGLAGPTLTSAVSLPSVARHRPSSVARDRAAPQAGLAGGERDGAGRAGRQRQRHVVRRCRPWSAARSARSRPRTIRRSASSSRSGCFISQCDSRRIRSRCGPPPS